MRVLVIAVCAIFCAVYLCTIADALVVIASHQIQGCGK